MLQLQNFEIVVLGQRKMCYCKRDSLVIFPVWAYELLQNLQGKDFFFFFQGRCVTLCRGYLGKVGSDVQLQLTAGDFVSFREAFMIAPVPDGVVWSDAAWLLRCSYIQKRAAKRASKGTEDGLWSRVSLSADSGAALLPTALGDCRAARLQPVEDVSGHEKFGPNACAEVVTLCFVARELESAWT